MCGQDMINQDIWDLKKNFLIFSLLLESDARQSDFGADRRKWGVGEQ